MELLNGKYFGHDYLCAGSCLMARLHSDIKAVIPSKIGSGCYNKIGHGAMADDLGLQYLEIEDGIEQIGDSAFRGCKNLISVRLPNTLKKIGSKAFGDCPRLEKFIMEVSLSRREYDKVMERSLGIYLGRRMLCSYQSDYMGMEWMTRLCRDIDVATAEIPRNIYGLFYMPSYLEREDAKRLNSFEADIFHYDDRKTYSEEEIFLKMISEDNISAPTTIKREVINDSRINEKKFQYPSQFAIVTFEEFDTIEIDDRMHVNFTMHLAHPFWPDGQRVVFDHKEYYVYRRNFLTTERDGGFRRQIVAVFDKNGVITDKNLSELVLAKYKLGAIL